MDAESKIDTELTIALSVNSEEREKSLDLDVGYSEEYDEWELIIKYIGDIEGVAGRLNAVVTPLFNGYAIIRIRENQISALQNASEVLYIEKPKSLVLEKMEGIVASCIERVRMPEYNLTGEGTIVAVIDSGIDIEHPDFRNEDGTTRILRLWDQSIQGRTPVGFNVGAEYTEEEINESLNGGARVETRDISGYGTAVTGVAAGNGRASNGTIVGVAPEASIVVVKLRPASHRGFPSTVELMTAIDYVIRVAILYNMPIAINLSFGNNYGSHSGNSLLENYIDSVSDDYKLSIAVGTGNEGIAGRHREGKLANRAIEEVEFIVSPYERGINLQIWKHFEDTFTYEIVTPTGQIIGPISESLSVARYITANSIIVAEYGKPSPFNSLQEIYISFIPQRDYIPDVVWKIRLLTRNIVNGEYNMWLPVSEATNTGTFFQIPSTNISLTIPSTAKNVISVGAYNSENNSFASFSGRGYNRNDLVKPDIVAPGVNINTASVGGGYDVRTGTSFATPFVTGG